MKSGAWEILVGGVAVLIFGIGIWVGSAIKEAYTERDRATAISNAIASCPQVADCNTQKVTDTLIRMANNGFNVRKYELCWTSPEDE